MKQYSEYAIHVDGIGYVSGVEPPLTRRVGEGEPDVFTERDRAIRKAVDTADAYVCLGLRNTARGVKVHSRTVTVTRDLWRESESIVASIGAEAC